MSRRGRISRIENNMRLQWGPQELCPTCEGRGFRDSIDGARTAARVRHRMACVSAKLAGDPEPEPLVLPNEPQILCDRCKGTGRIPRPVALALASEPNDGGEQLARRLLEVADRLKGKSIERDD